MINECCGCSCVHVNAIESSSNVSVSTVAHSDIDITASKEYAAEDVTNTLPASQSEQSNTSEFGYVPEYGEAVSETDASIGKFGCLKCGVGFR